MRFSSSYIPTLKEAPAAAEVISHQLLLRAGMIRQLTSGIYIYLPLGLRAINKVANIVRQAMDKVSVEISMPMVQPADLWQETGRWDMYGKELLRLKDRHEREYCLGPTHEEVITDLIRGEVRSYRQLPLRMYQIQAKFRDEIRPRFGLMRGREFVMKDAYSFDKDEAGADSSYRAMYDAYGRIFERLGLEYRAVEADSGSIGGSFSHEFMILADTGEDSIAVCSVCDYAANIERAALASKGRPSTDDPGDMQLVPAAGIYQVETQAKLAGVSPHMVIKTLIFIADGTPVAAMVAGDREVNEIKLKNLLNAAEVIMATAEQAQELTGAPHGFVGAQGLAMPIYADYELAECQGWVMGANKPDAIVTQVSLSRDTTITAYADLRVAVDGDACPRCSAAMQLYRGIECGHTFKLGTKYSESMHACYLDAEGKEQTIIMGCYGIGVSRVVAACIEQNFDAHGILFPPPIAPFAVTLLNLDVKSTEVCAHVEALYALLQQQGFDVLLDDRDERAGVKFNDADLLGSPMQLILGGKNLAKGIVEAKDRRSGQKTELPLATFGEAFSQWQADVYAGWGIEAQ